MAVSWGRFSPWKAQEEKAGGRGRFVGASGHPLSGSKLPGPSYETWLAELAWLSWTGCHGTGTREWAPIFNCMPVPTTSMNGE